MTIVSRDSPRSQSEVSHSRTLSLDSLQQSLGAIVADEILGSGEAVAGRGHLYPSVLIKRGKLSLAGFTHAGRSLIHNRPVVAHGSRSDGTGVGGCGQSHDWTLA